MSGISWDTWDNIKKEDIKDKGGQNNKGGRKTAGMTNHTQLWVLSPKWRP